MSVSDFIKYPTGKIGKGEFCRACMRYNTRNVTVNAVVIKEEKVLLVLRNNEPEKGKWCLPGGYLGWDETVEECCLRELKEETVLAGKVVRWLGERSDLSAGDGRQNVDLFYLVEVSEGEFEPDGEIERVEWFGLDSLPEMAFDHGRLIGDYLKK